MASAPKKLINTVDIFCGAGGLSCGFELFNGSHKFRTVLGIDVDRAAVNTFNANFRSEVESPLALARQADVTWFTHPAEVLLYYLVHYCFSLGDPLLKAQLGDIKFFDFLHDLRECDEDFRVAAKRIASLTDYKEELARVPDATFSLALPRALLSRLGISSLSQPQPDLRAVPWSEEYTALLGVGRVGSRDLNAAQPVTGEDAETIWLARVKEVALASEKIGRGQNKNNSTRLKALATFFSSKPAGNLRDKWVAWRAERESLRAKFCLNAADKISELYAGDRRVHLVLGGPPCKGFSRIGRPVIASLRDQGVHAWSHRDFGDERNALMCQYVLFLKALQPDTFLFENVSNFESQLRTPSGVLDAPSLLSELIEELSGGGLHYHIRHSVVNARDHAVPQDRRRFIMFGVNAVKARESVASSFFAFDKRFADVPLETALMGLGEPARFRQGGDIATGHCVPVYDLRAAGFPEAQSVYLAWVQQTDPVTGRRCEATTAHIYREPREDDRIFIEYVAPGMRWMDLKVDRAPLLGELRAVLREAASQTNHDALRARLSNLAKIADGSLLLRLLLEHIREKHGLSEQHLLLEGYLKNGGSTHGDWLERLAPDRPCKTIVAHIGKDTYGYWHPTRPRALTIREAARVQSFPDFFRLDAAGVVDTYAVIGNAVPPLMANAFAKRLADLDRKHRIFADEASFAPPPTISRAKQLPLFA